MKLSRSGVYLAGLAVAASAFVAAGCGGGGGGGGAPEALPSSSCTAIEYKGDGDPDYIIASDMPLQGSSRFQTEQINTAIRYALEQADWKAGDYNIGFQACDDATAQAAKWDSGKASQNANAYAANDKVIGVIGTFNSGAAAIEIPVLNQAPDGGIPMVSPANTYPCLTVNLPGGCDSTEPDKYYPSGTRNYVRVVAHDAYQGAAVAEFMQSKGVKSVYILNDKEAYGLGVATTVRNASESLGIKIAGFEAWDPKATSYTSQMQKIKASGADAVFLGGLIDENGAQVIKDKVAVLGPNDGDVLLLAPDGFTTQATIDEAGPASKGMYMSIAGVPIDQFKGAALDFIDGLQSGPLKGKAIDPYAIYGGQAAIVLLDAIGASDGTRSDVIKQLFATQVTDGLLGSFKFDENGDPEDASGAVVGFTVYVATDELTTETTISPKPETVAAAGGK
ncbi:branched-chain amino acid ABC transporter substrate-binding protein [Gaiella sp.]|uniref:branched-chain amino acid ABC transporter substrate-binding protein n=1 Tax=Gaiella sp. TaxID=2663207 RepID=UPI002E2FBDE0|nr:branched-chain amino acid ABC transporter substrate-binding protein [Gaiella sp.]HEX5583514.1 branched-chain amino acid ABC transporter substrate-binding protein [Gaiella sp.]